MLRATRTVLAGHRVIVTALTVPGVSTAWKSHRTRPRLRKANKTWSTTTKLVQKISYRGEKKGGPALKKIVIVSSKPERDECLLELVKTLFPDCEICVVSTMGETLAQCRADSFSGLVTTDTIGRA